MNFVQWLSLDVWRGKVASDHKICLSVDRSCYKSTPLRSGSELSPKIPKNITKHWITLCLQSLVHNHYPLVLHNVAIYQVVYALCITAFMIIGQRIITKCSTESENWAMQAADVVNVKSWLISGRIDLICHFPSEEALTSYHESQPSFSLPVY